MTDPTTTAWQHEVDLLVVGAGAGGMTAALTGALSRLDTLLVEKATTYGGTTALSGGGIWVPNNPTLARAGITDPEERVVEYLEHITQGSIGRDRLVAYAHHGPAMFEMFEKHARHLTFSWCPGYSDYHPEAPGGRPEGRSVECPPFDMHQLGELAYTQRGSAMKVPGGLIITSADYVHLNMVTRTWRGRWRALKLGVRSTLNKLRRRQMVSLGQALVARLRISLRDAGVPVWLETPLLDLVRDEDGAVVGAVVERDGASYRIRARRGVIIASGGFDHNEAMRKEYLPEVGRADVSGGADTNTGDGILIGHAAGGALDLMDDAWWMPAVRKPDGRVHSLVSERSIPNSVILSPKGERFTNEASPYVTFVHDQIAHGHPYLWFVMDQTARRRYPFGATVPGADLPQKWYDAGTAHKASTLDELARLTGMDAATLTASVQRWNEIVASGEDADFGRGESAYERYYGDPTLPNPVLGAVDNAPYYAVRIEAGDLGTKGGLVTDRLGKVLDADGNAVTGLYATGNVAASVMGNDYAGAGATIGPAMVFGYLAALHAAGATN
ncbi:FAD-dependent oxidoreductase [Nocardioides kongjuensis]|uniref:3-oxosteroid 1-dehydrogenase n=1 Tax=Nocardioides kongjuensis TaxID=349522 RepID=A0A852RLV1_9ACTN|nr:FAD-dependent oxidoreductase [Nocardioides kongjuensis]NYD31598.1 3-oxosteroid 1-dehydrogenase [Nocardioides kongjuensis]